MSERYSGTIKGDYYIYSDGQRVRVSWDIIDSETGGELSPEAWDMALKKAQEFFSKGFAAAYPSRWERLRAAWKGNPRV